MEVNNNENKDDLKIEKLRGEAAKKLTKNYFLYNSAVKITPGNYILPSGYKRWHSIYRDLTVRETDFFVISFPKAGTTWTQEMTWCIMNDLNYEGAKELLMKRFPYLEYEGLIPRNLMFLMPSLDKGDPCIPGENWKIVTSMKNPRAIKTHLHKELLPKSIWTVKPKIVYVCRDPRDVCVSFYYHSIRYTGFRGSFNNFVDLFLTDNLLMFSPYWRHVLDFWDLRHEDNILFIRYEQMKSDLPSIVCRVAKFFGKSLTEEQVKTLVEHLSFENMKNNKAVNQEALLSFPYKKKANIKFMRNGKVGDWKTHLSEEQVESFRIWTEKNLRNSDFPYYRNY